MMRAVLIVLVTCFCVSAAPGQALAEDAATGSVIERADFVAPEPIAAPEPASLTILTESQVGYQQGCCAADGGCGTHDTGACTGAGCGGCCRTCGCGTCACNMYQHYAYFPPMHGYYYFRPYHHSHVRQQQMLVQSWGGNPAHPYANEIFEAVYQQYRTEEAASATAGKH